MWTTDGSGEVAASAARATGARRRTRALVKCIVVVVLVVLVGAIVWFMELECDKSERSGIGKRVNGAD